MRIPDSERDRHPALYLGIDGEGLGRKDHRYVMLARSSDDGRHSAVLKAKKGKRLSTVECLDFLLDCPLSAKVFAFAFGYDLTHILRDLPDHLLYKLFRPELRPAPAGVPRYKRTPQPIFWRGYSLNLISRKFTVSQGKHRRTVVWDVFAFFGTKFTTALDTWKVGETEKVSAMRLMKDQRADFDKLKSKQIETYCLQECSYMAGLAKKLIDAHNDVGLTLKSYFGAGSSASAALKQWGIDQVRRSGPPEISEAVSSAFFGGRFENSRIGQIPGPIYGYDISSAYPYQTAFLPCLGCGTWTHTTNPDHVLDCNTAVVRYRLPDTGCKTWGPFPFRLDDGSIAFPSCSGGGWVWLDEYNAGKKLFPSVKFREAWTYSTRCQHRPFADIPRFYLERLRLGKEGPGIVLKLAMNSCYGKLAQSIGDAPPFQSWVWAGMITSGTRAQLLSLMAQHKSLDSVLMVATDGLYSTEKIATPAPMKTGTDTEHKKPLGGWEMKVVDAGMFAARPGIYFPLNPSQHDMDKVRARGIGRGAMFSQWKKAVDAWESGESSVVLANVTRFHGAKSCISKSGKPGAETFTRSPLFGQWSTRPIELTFNPLPKRERALKDGRLTLRRFAGLESVPYDAATVSMEAMQLKLAQAEMDEQPDGDDFADFEA